jgi:ADP-heptose:LPS heptosyltransferase
VHTNDTGLMHIAAAFNKSIISYWGNTVPEFGMTPYLPKPSVNENKSAYVILNQVKDLACRPCSKIGFDRCPKGHFNCMTSL